MKNIKINIKILDQINISMQEVKSLPVDLVHAMPARKKRGPKNKLSKKKQLEKVRELYFEEGYTIIDIAKTLGVHRNTVTSDVKYWTDQFDKEGGEDKITEFFYKQKSLLESQKIRLLKKLKMTSDFESQNKLEKLLFGLCDREMKFYLKFIPLVKKSSKISKKLVKKIIRDLAFDNFGFFFESELIKEIIKKAKCDLSTANSIVHAMKNLGLDQTRFFDSRVTLMLEFANMCGYVSDEEYSKFKQEIAKKDEDEERQYAKNHSEPDEKEEEEENTYDQLLDATMKKYLNGSRLF